MIYRCMRQFEQQLAKNIPTFKGRFGHRNSIFQRVSSTQNTLEYLLSQWGPRPDWVRHDQEYVHDVDWSRYVLLRMLLMLGRLW